jgi:hypothetical protein
MAVEDRSVQAEVISERVKRNSMSEEELHGANVAIVGAPLQQRSAVFYCVR